MDYEVVWQHVISIGACAVCRVLCAVCRVPCAVCHVLCAVCCAM